MKKIMILTGPLGGHGGEETVIHQFMETIDSGYSVELFVSENIGDTSWLSDIQKKFSNITVLNSTSRFIKYLRILKKLIFSKTDMIISFTPRLIFAVWLIKKIFFKKFLIVSWLQWSVFNTFSYQARKFLHFANYHLVISDGIRKELLECNIKRSNIFTLYNSVARSNDIITKKMNCTEFIYMGRISDEKNLEELLYACSGLSGKWNLKIYGTDDTKGKLNLKKCQELVEHLEIKSQVSWMGWQYRPWRNIKYADCLVLTSKTESFGMVICEAISRGLPVIASDCPVGPKYIVNSKNGFLYQLGDVKQLTKYMQGFINQKYAFKTEQVKESIEKYYINHFEDNLYMFLNKVFDSEK